MMTELSLLTKSTGTGEGNKNDIFSEDDLIISDSLLLNICL